MGLAHFCKTNVKQKKIVDKPSSVSASSWSCPQGPTMSQPYNSGSAEVCCAPEGAEAGSSVQAPSWPPSSAPAKHSPAVASRAGFPSHGAGLAAGVAAIIHEGWETGKQMWL